MIVRWKTAESGNGRWTKRSRVFSNVDLRYNSLLWRSRWKVRRIEGSLAVNSSDRPIHHSFITERSRFPARATKKAPLFPGQTFRRLLQGSNDSLWTLTILLEAILSKSADFTRISAKFPVNGLAWKKERFCGIFMTNSMNFRVILAKNCSYIPIPVRKSRFL